MQPTTARAAQARKAPMLEGDALWYKDAIIYQLHVRAYYDSNGDGIGDFRGLIEKLDYLKELGITCIWVMTFFPSPLKEDGYDIADYHDIHPSMGTLVDFETADLIYVNAGATRPADAWLDRLADGGRLILPLTIDQSFSLEFDKITPGCVFRIERRGDDYLAALISPVAIFPCAGSRDRNSERALAAALAAGGAERVTRLYRHNEVDEKRCWLRAPGWSLACD